MKVPLDERMRRSKIKDNFKKRLILINGRILTAKEYFLVLKVVNGGVVCTFNSFNMVKRVFSRKKEKFPSAELTSLLEKCNKLSRENLLIHNIKKFRCGPSLSNVDPDSAKTITKVDQDSNNSSDDNIIKKFQCGPSLSNVDPDSAKNITKVDQDSNDSSDDNMIKKFQCGPLLSNVDPDSVKNLTMEDQDSNDSSDMICTMDTKSYEEYDDICKEAVPLTRESVAEDIPETNMNTNSQCEEPSDGVEFLYASDSDKIPEKCPTEEGLRHICSKLGVEFFHLLQFKVPPRGKIIRVSGHGDCLFKALAVCLTGKEDQHFEIRLCIVSHMLTNMKEHLLPHIHPFTSVETYVQSKGMNRKRTWGTDVEILSFCDMTNLNVNVFLNSVNGPPHVFEPQYTKGCNMNVYIINHYNRHYDVVI